MLPSFIIEFRFRVYYVFHLHSNSLPGLVNIQIIRICSMLILQSNTATPIPLQMLKISNLNVFAFVSIHMPVVHLHPTPSPHHFNLPPWSPTVFFIHIKPGPFCLLLPLEPLHRRSCTAAAAHQTTGMQCHSHRPFSPASQIPKTIAVFKNAYIAYWQTDTSVWQIIRIVLFSFRIENRRDGKQRATEETTTRTSTEKIEKKERKKKRKTREKSINRMKTVEYLQ